MVKEKYYFKRCFICYWSKRFSNINFLKDIRAQTIARLEERIRDGRDERVKLERTHDEHLGALKKRLNEVHEKIYILKCFLIIY